LIKNSFLDLNEASIQKELSTIKIKLEVTEEGVEDKKNQEEESIEKKKIRRIASCSCEDVKYRT
jgi:hypothetical protein